MFTILTKSSRLRWVAVSSTAYQDADGQFVTRDALIRSANEARDLGVLLWYHDPKLVLGTCDYRTTMRGGKFLLESGTFALDEIGLRLLGKRLGVSIGFRATLDGNTFHDIEIIERSLTPPGLASNRYAQLLGVTMDDAAKEALLRQLLGNELVEQILTSVSGLEETAMAEGTDFKAVDTEPVAEEVPVAEEETEITEYTLADVIEHLSGMEQRVVDALTSLTERLSVIEDLLVANTEPAQEVEASKSAKRKSAQTVVRSRRATPEPTPKSSVETRTLVDWLLNSK